MRQGNIHRKKGKGTIIMGKFDGILLCTDLDGTLLDNKCTVSQENIDAIEYFKKEGGAFTFATGRVPSGAAIVCDMIKPNVPGIVFNGAGIYDFEKDESLWDLSLDDGAISVVDHTLLNFPDMAFIVCTDKKVYFSKVNELIDHYMLVENLPLDLTPYKQIPMPWKKVVFIETPEEIERLMSVLSASEYFDKYDFVRSTKNYYEFLPKGASKGMGVLMLAEILGIKKERIIAVGDNENDISMLTASGLGVAVENSHPRVISVADMITSSNSNHAIAKIISDLDSGKITL